MNILGEGFYPQIIKQINTRQKIHGKGWFNTERDLDYSKYTNANTSWCKLVSGATITNNRLLNNELIRELGYTDKGDLLARRYILFNGTSTNNNGNDRSGIGLNKDTGTTSGKPNAYTSWGIPSIDFGYRPMAGIQSVIVRHKNRGSIRTATVEIKAWDKASFEIVDVLYLRLGFSVLLEWGHSMYYYKDKNGQEVLESNPNFSLADDFLNITNSYKGFLEKIKNQRLASEGNYDAMFGKVSNFDWSFNEDGSYDITLNLVSAGDIIESFKVKGNPLNITINPPNNPEEDTSDRINLESADTYKVLETYAPTSDIANYLYKAASIMESPDNTTSINYLPNYNLNTKPTNYWGSGGDYERNKNGTKNFVKIKTVNEKNFENPNRLIDGSTTFASFYYIRLGNLLEFIEKGVMYQVSNNAATVPLLDFDTDIRSNLCHAPSQIMSYDFRVCMVRRSVQFGEKGENREYFNRSGILNGTVNNTDFAEKFMSGIKDVGRIMNIYVNCRYILVKLDELTDKDTNEIKLLDFLKEILSGINGALAGYTKLDLFIDEENNTAKIIDQNPFPSVKKALKEAKNSLTDYAFFEAYGYSRRANNNYGTAGFIQDFKFITEITPELSTMITVSATSNGNVVGENNTALSKLNAGLKDKYKESINGGRKPLQNSSNLDANTQDNLRKNYNTAYNEYVTAANNLKNYVDDLYDGVFVPEEADENKDAFTTFLKKWKNYKKAESDDRNFDKTTKTFKTVTRFQPGTGFIPFNLTITIDGLSGMKIASKFIIDASYLPSNYPDTVDFLIKNIQHEIKNNKWTTTLESYCISQGDDDDEYDKIPVDDVKEEVEERRESPASTSGDCSSPEPLVDQSKAVPSNFRDKDVGTKAGIKLNNIKAKNQKYIWEEYMPVLETDFGTLTKGMKCLITIQAIHEGFYPGSRAYRTRNPGNIGNTDSGNNSNMGTLKGGIQAQVNYANNAAGGLNNTFKFGRKTRSNYYSPELKKCVPGFDINYQGELGYYLLIYATGTRLRNSYLETVLGFLKYNGITANYKTKLKDIIAIR